MTRAATDLVAEAIGAVLRDRCDAAAATALASRAAAAIAGAAHRTTGAIATTGEYDLGRPTAGRGPGARRRR